MSCSLMSAASCVQDRIGIDVELLDEMQKSILGLYRSPATPSQTAASQTNLDAIQDSINGLCSASIQSALYKAAGQLLDDLHRNVRLLGTPERYRHPSCPECPAAQRQLNDSVTQAFVHQ